jgi:tetratricopeptide (TPR) repeat protein
MNSGSAILPPTSRITAAAGAEPGLADPLVADLAARWRNGERPLAEEYLDRSPELWDRPDAALELIAEELVLREEFGEPVSAAELAARFPRWQAQVEVLVECQRALGPPAVPPKFPEPGDQVGDFDLVSELGRGGHGRAYLATQPALAGRLIVLKLGPRGGREHLSLARLQHTHIVPLYSVHEFPEWGLVGLCLPYFGGVTLAELFTGGSADSPSATGSKLFARAAAAGPAPDAPAARGPAGEFLDRAAPWEVVCWIGACLADALQYAHDRDLMHLDLKPSNVLVAADGTPMLLDFHLARGPLKAGDPAPTWLGGTPGYMAPEQQAAIQAVRDGTTLATSVDGRADVFALGALLRELWDRLAADRDRRSVGLADVLARCTAERAEDRYPSAAALAADLRRHLVALPLRGVGNRSWSEKWQKWRRRRPLALPLALTMAAVLALGAGLVRQADRQAQRARAALRDGEARLAEKRYGEASEAGRNGEAALAGVPFHRTLRARLRETRGAADRAQAAEELHEVCDRVRPLYAADGLTPAQVAEAAGRCREVWDRRAEIASRLANQPTPELERQWRNDLFDLAVLIADLEVRGAAPDQSAAAGRRALDVLAEAESLLGPSAPLDVERKRHATAIGVPTATPNAVVEGAWEHLAVGRGYLAAGDLDRSAAALDRAVALEPQSVWAHYYRGACSLKRGEAAEAVAAFSVCVALAPESAWSAYNRGLAYARSGRTDRAGADFDRAIGLDPGLAVAYLGRAAVRRQAGLHADALADLGRAAEAGASRAEVEYQVALVRLAAKDRPAAVARLRDCLALDPSHAEARELLARLGGE